MKPDGTIADMGAVHDDSGHPKPEDLLPILRRSLQEMARTNECKAVAVVFNVIVTLPQSNLKSDAIQASIEHENGYSVEVFFPYQVVGDEIAYGKTFAQPVNTRFLGHPDRSAGTLEC